jgi:hypothetical protein
MKKERLVLELDIYIYMNTWHLHQGFRMEDMKEFTSDVQFNNKIAIDVAQTSHMTFLQVLWLIYSFHEGLYFIGDHLIVNNIFLDKSYNLSTYVFRIYWSNNNNSLQTPRSNVTWSLIPLSQK